MKTFIFKVSLSLFLIFGVATLTQAQVPHKIIKTFYGTKTRKNFKNPCKGATFHKCGTIEISSELVTQDTLQNVGYYLKKQVIYDPLNVPIAEKTETTTGTLSFPTLQHDVNQEAQTLRITENSSSIRKR